MSQLIVFDYPPNFADIDAKFHTRGKPVLYSYGNSIYNPMSMRVPMSLIVHEAVHGVRQLAHLPKVVGMTVDPEIGVIEWWRKYIEDPHFRLIEELLAHREEFKHITRGANRQTCRIQLSLISKRLSGALYDGIITRRQAKRMLTLTDAEVRAHIPKGQADDK